MAPALCCLSILANLSWHRVMKCTLTSPTPVGARIPRFTLNSMPRIGAFQVVSTEHDILGHAAGC